MDLDDDGDLMVFDSSGTLYEAAAHEDLYWDADSRPLLLRGSDEPCGEFAAFQDRRGCQHLFMRVILKSGLADAEVKLVGAYCADLIFGHRFLLGVPSLVKGMALSVVQKGKLGKYLEKRYDAWKRALGSMQLGSHYFKAQERAADGRATHAFREGIMPLPYRTCTCSAAVALLCNFAFSNHNNCGFTQARDRQRAREMLESLVQPLLRRERLALAVFLDSQVQFRMPAPPVGKRPRTLCFTNGALDVGSFTNELSTDPGGAFGRSLCEWLEERFPRGRDYMMMEILEAVFGTKWRATLGMQLVHALGGHLENVLSESKGQAADYFDCMLVRPMRLSEATRLELQSRLRQYVQGSRREASIDKCKYLSVSLDKSRVYGLGMTNVACVLPSNKGWWAPPQV